MLMGSFALANNVKTSKSVVSPNKFSKNITVYFENLSTLNFDDLADCTITLKKKNPDGTWSEYQIIVHGTTCDKLVKTVISSL